MKLNRLLGLLALSLAFGSLPVAAQVAPGAGAGAEGGIAGTVEDADTGQPIQTATVSVWSASDSTLVTGAVTDPGGDFRISGLRPGHYYVQVSFIGYDSQQVDEIEIDDQSPMATLGSIRLRPDTAQLGEVQVTGERDYMEFRIDRTVYNVEDQPVTAGGSATDVLRNIPSLEVDIDGNVSLRGSQNVAVLINGRPSNMSGEMLASFLESLPSSTVERIEVIPNPSARYEPDGMSGILNIVLKQDADLGFSGTISANGSTQDEYGGSVMLGYGEGRWNLRATYGLRQNVRMNSGARLNEYRFLDPMDVLRTEDESRRRSISNMLNLNTDYRIGRNSTITLSTLASIRSGDSDGITRYWDLNADRELDVRYDRSTDEESDDLNFDVGLAFQRIVEPGRNELTAEIEFETEGEDDFEDYRQEVLQAITEPEADLFSLENSLSEESGIELSAEANYIRPLGEASKLEAGFRSTLDVIDSDYFAENFDPTTQLWVPDLSVNNTFEFAEQVHAAYGILGHQFGKWGTQLGVRVEQALTTFELLTANESYDNNYFSIFPSAFLTYQLSETHRFRTSYSKRVNRPNTWQLNPFTDNDDPLFRRFGNPRLKPEYTHSFEVAYSLIAESATFTLSPYYRRTVDEVEWVQTVDDDGITNMTFENLSSESSYGTEAITSLRLGDWMSGFLSLSLYRLVADGSNLEGDLSNDALSWNVRGNLSFTINPTLDVQLFTMYRPATKIAGGERGAWTMTNLAVRQRLFNRAASLSLRLEDPFNLAGFDMWRETDRYYLEMDRSWEARQVSLAFQYTFGGSDRDRRRQQREEGQQPDQTGDDVFEGGGMDF